MRMSPPGSAALGTFADCAYLIATLTGNTLDVDGMRRGTAPLADRLCDSNGSFCCHLFYETDTGRMVVPGLFSRYVLQNMVNHPI